MPSPGTPTMISTITSSGIDPLGTPAAPRAVITDMPMTISWVNRSSWTPNTWARNSTVIPSNNAVPFMFMVAPSGTTKPAIDLGTPNFSSAVRMVVGIVALELEVENAVIISSRIRR